MRSDELWWTILKKISKSIIIKLSDGHVIPLFSEKKFKGHFFRWPFFLIECYNYKMSKRYSGKSFKDSSASKKPKLSLKEKRKQKKEKTKKS